MKKIHRLLPKSSHSKIMSEVVVQYHPLFYISAILLSDMLLINNWIR